MLCLVCGCVGDSDSANDASDTDKSVTTGTSEGTEPGATTAEPWEPVPARGIHVDWVEANQAVGVPIGVDGGEVGPSDRIAALLRNRRTLIRAFWTLDEGWQPREIEARLTLRHNDGTTEVLSQTKQVDGDSFIGDLNRVFFWGIEAEDTQPGLSYRVDLWETTPDHDDVPQSDSPPGLPLDGGQIPVGIENSYMVLKVVVVPFEYDDGQGCSTKPDTSEETMQLFEDLMYMQNPVDRVEYTLHAPVAWTTPLSGFGTLNTWLSNLRFEENASPETYYYGLIDVCGQGLGGAGGQAYGIPSDPTSMDVAYQRVSSGLSLEPQWSAETFVHEVGHSQGRRHVACSGEAGVDPSYPHEGGIVGEWGFGVLDFALRHPTVYKDYMTYCNPTWVGTWGWNKIYPVIRALSTWDADYPGNGAPAPDAYGGSLLVGVLLANGEQHWHTVPGSVSAQELDETQRIEFAVGNDVLATQPTRVTELPDTTGELMVVTPLPPSFDTTTRLTRIVGGKRMPIERSSVKLRHTLRGG
jgi:hypothetical protein